jgi:ubiquinone/menaquinone biosynthesis C-methylase UbiE
MSVYRDHVLPFLTDRLLSGREYLDLRRQVVAGLFGRVIEIGFGSGLNLPHLPREVEEILTVEPAPGALKLARPRIVASQARVESLGNDATRLPCDDHHADAVLMTWTLCSVPDQLAALQEIRRVLKPGGALHLVEHGLAPTPCLAKWQRRLTPLQRRLAGGCRLDTDVPALLAAAGFKTDDLQRIPFPGLRLAGCHYFGRVV